MPAIQVNDQVIVTNSNTLISPGSGWSETDKWWISIFLGILFAIFASPLLFGLTNIFIAGGLCTVPLHEPQGITILGLVIHTIIFIFVVRILLC